MVVDLFVMFGVVLKCGVCGLWLLVLWIRLVNIVLIFFIVLLKVFILLLVIGM